MHKSFSERTIDAVRKARCCGVVNIDPVYDRLPEAVRSRHDNPVGAMEDFSSDVVDLVAGVVPFVKFNIAYFERYGRLGLEAYHRLIGHAHSRQLLVIGDVKRGDVGHTAEQYAHANFPAAPIDPSETPDAITINGYFGWDGVKPFVERMQAGGRGIFVLVRTSNESAASIQDLALSDGRKVHEAVGALVNGWSRETAAGPDSYGSIGAVVATRDHGDAIRLRQAMPNTIFLVPGYGAQGGTADDFRPYLDSQGQGALIAAGRSVIYAHDNPRYRDRHGSDWSACVAGACRDFAEDLGRITPR